MSDLLEEFADYDGARTNPKSKFDWFEIGGRFKGMLHLKQAKKTRRFFGLLPGFPVTRVSIAKKDEIDQQRLLSDPPAALLYRRQWSSSPFFAEGEALAKWREEFARLFAEIPDGTTLTIVDCH
jgi:hypothetical protein